MTFEEWAKTYTGGLLHDEDVEARTMRLVARDAWNAAQPKWRPMSEAPIDSTTILMLLDDDIIASGYLSFRGNYMLHRFGFADSWADYPKAWMPLPPPPQEQRRQAA